MFELSARDARRLAVTAQLLASPRPTTLDEVATGLSAVQVDLTNHVATSPDLVFWSRLGRRRRPGDIDRAISERRLVEIDGHLRPAEEVRFHLALMRAWPGPNPPEYLQGLARWVDANHVAHAQVLAQLAERDEMAAREFDCDFALDWRSSGWNNQKNTTMLLERLAEKGEVAVSRRVGRERLWSLAKRVHPHCDPVPVDEARRELMRRRLRSLGLARERAPKVPTEPLDVGDIGIPAVVTDVKGTWRVDPELLDTTFRGRTALLSPLDRLVVDRRRLDELFEFDFALEMYKPAETRIWGYYALPVLHGDRLVGTVDAESDRRGGVLHVHAIRQEVPWSDAVRRSVGRELDALAAHLELDLDAGTGRTA